MSNPSHCKNCGWDYPREIIDLKTGKTNDEWEEILDKNWF